MFSWNKLSKETQRTILAVVVMSGGAASTRCLPPIICDPAPPPRTATPTPTFPPIICDPAPPPRTTPPPSNTPTRFQTPIICDPPPPPARTPTPRENSPTPRSATPLPPRSPIICDPAPPPSRSLPTATPTAQRKFQLRNLQMTTDAALPGAVVRGKVLDANGQPLGNVQITLQGNGMYATVTAPDGSFSMLVTNTGAYSLVVGNDKTSALFLQLQKSDVAIVEYQDLGAQSNLSLPLAEIRTVDIVWGDELVFAAESPWTNARYRWSVSGGSLIEQDDTVTWEPPAAPGRYLLQLIADWGRDGLAVDALALTVTEDGLVYIG